MPENVKNEHLGKTNSYKVIAEIQEIEFQTTEEFQLRKIHMSHQKI